MRTQVQLALVAGSILTVTAAGVIAAVAVNEDGGSGAPSVASQAVAPQAVAPQAVAPQAVAPEPAAPQAVAPEAVTPEPGAPAPAAPPVTVKPQAATAAEQAPVSYTVKPGDNLSDIAAWFELNGFGGLYEANRSVIGANPDLIRPGQTFTVTGGTLTMG